MKLKGAVIVCSISLIFLLLVHGYSIAQMSSGSTTLPIGIVDVRRALRECNATEKYREQTNTEDAKMNVEEEQLDNQIKALALNLRALKPDSSDYAAQYLEYMQKQGELKNKQEINRQLKLLKHQQWTQKLYQEILRLTKTMAAEKGLAMVLGSDEPQFPIQQYEELAMTLNTHKVLYGNGCHDLTDEIIAELDKEVSKFIN